MKNFPLSVRKLLKILFWSIAILGVGWVLNLLWYKPYSIELFYERMFFQQLTQFEPEKMSEYGLYEKYGFTGHNKRLDNISDEQLKKEMDFRINQYDMLLSYRRSKQSAEQLLSTDILYFYLEDFILSQQFPYYDYTLNPNNGIHVQLPLILKDIHQIKTFQDAEDYLLRLDDFEEKFDQVIQNLLIQEGLMYQNEINTFPPRELIDLMIQQIELFLSGGIYNNFLYQDFQEKVHRLDALTDEANQEFNYEVKLEVEENILPAYRKLLKTLKQIRDGNATDDLGLWKYQDDNYYYQYLLKHHLNVDLEAVLLTYNTSSLEEIALAEVEKINGQYANWLSTYGYADTLSIKVLMDSLHTVPELFYRNDSLGRKDFINDFNLTRYDLEKKMTALFGKAPKAKLEVDHIPYFFSESAPFYTYLGSDFSGERPAQLYFNMNEMRSFPTFLEKDYIFTYTFPGLHFQSAKQREIETLPSFRRAFSFTSFKEGWKYYVRQVANDENWYNTPLENLGKIQSDMLLAHKMLIDIYIHTRRWSKAQAIGYLVEKAGVFPYRATIAVNDCAINPAKACAYLVGYQRIEQLKLHAQEKATGDFNLSEFHQLLLLNGSLPLKILEQIVYEKYGQPIEEDLAEGF